MPTGYTADVKDGKVTEFASFALRCARAFGALIEMRDDAMDATIPEAFKPSPYHRDELKQARRRLADLRVLTQARCAQRAAGAFDESMREWTRARDERQVSRERYAAMLAQVRAWEPPSADHRELQRFMESQLVESIRFDCERDDESWKPKRLTAQEWLAREVERAERNVDYHEKEWANEQKRSTERTRWVQQLRDSLTGVVSQ